MGGQGRAHQDSSLNHLPPCPRCRQHRRQWHQRRIPRSSRARIVGSETTISLYMDPQVKPRRLRPTSTMPDIRPRDRLAHTYHQPHSILPQTRSLQGLLHRHCSRRDRITIRDLLAAHKCLGRHLTATLRLLLSMLAARDIHFHLHTRRTSCLPVHSSDINTAHQATTPETRETALHHREALYRLPSACHPVTDPRATFQANKPCHRKRLLSQLQAGHSTHICSRNSRSIRGLNLCSLLRRPHRRRRTRNHSARRMVPKLAVQLRRREL